MSRATLVAQIAQRGFAHAGASEPALVVAAEGADSSDTGAYTFPVEMVLPGWSLEHLPSTPNFYEAIGNIVTMNRARPILLNPPQGSRALVRERTSSLASMDLHDAAAYELASHLEPGAVGAVLLPVSTVVGHRGRKARFSIFSRAQPLLVTFVSGLPGIHPSFQFALVHLRGRTSDSEVLRILEVPDSASDEEVVADLERLLRMQGGRSKHGYVVREQLPLEESLAFARHDPIVFARREELRAFGPVTRLGDLVESVRSMSAGRRDQFVSSETPDAVPVLTGRSITRDGSLDLVEVRDWTLPDPTYALQPGDIVLRALLHPSADAINVAEIRPLDLPLAAGPHVLALRPTPQFVEESRPFVVAFLRSARAVELLRAEGATSHVGARHLLDLEVPVPDAALSAALRDLEETAQQFDRWRKEAEALTRSVFNEGSADEARLRVLQSGEVVRQRAQAAALMDDAGYRIRSRYPYPIAYRWRTVEAASGTPDAVWSVVECAEVVLCYSAMVALVFARAAGHDVRYLATIRERLAERRQGTNLGDWVAILSEVRDSREFRSVPTAAPFSEVRELLRDTEVDEALRRLKERRDARSHSRALIPGEQANEFEVATADLGLLLDAAGFLADYTLTHVSGTQWDSLRGSNRLTVRQLMGDHPVVPPQVVRVPDVAIESGSLYLVDRERRFHLARPLLLGENCPACGNWSTFHLDTYDPKASACTVKSLEHGHTMQRPDLVEAFRAVQLLD